ncbi:hypothetical protein SEUCBS140593_010161 [Sporothrix eucalyptigena]|uniref:O-methyltransferase domain-containing protein n=1 Tax=Sporothrix eucalyptigena TaxID=1812306 RepID=A0ABP0D0B0_9PEZI
MSLLQNIIRELQANVASLEKSLASEANGASPHLFEARPYASLDDDEASPPWDAFALIDKIRLDLKAVEAAVTPTSKLYLNTVFASNKAAALSTAAVLGVTDAIIGLGGRASLDDIAAKVGTNAQKLGRILRLVAGEFIYREVAPDVFANTRHSMGLRKATKAYHFLKFSAYEGGAATAALCANLTNPKTKDSYQPKDAPFSQAVSNGKAFDEYVMEPAQAEMLQNITEGVVPWLNRTTRSPLLLDYPWHELGNSRVIDVGCGPADSGFDILQKNPKLTWVLQDLPHMIDLVKTLVPPALADRVKSGDISFQVQDYFEANTARGDVWYLRGVIREYDDADALRVLKNVVAAMRETKGSRLVLNEVLCSTPAIVDDNSVVDAPSKHLPYEQASLYELANLITWNTYALFGGKERTYRDTVALLEAAGLHVTKLYKFRTFTSNIECIVRE